jgi:thiol:disulfide interchange protein DsbA
MMGSGEKFHMPLFRALHEEKRPIYDEDDLVEFAGEQGIDGAEFRKAFNSFFVNMRVRRAQEMGRRFGIDGVPSVIVNGKFRTSPSQTGSRQQMIKVIDHLIAAESRKQSAETPSPAASGGS